MIDVLYGPSIKRQTVGHFRRCAVRNFFETLSKQGSITDHGHVERNVDLIRRSRVRLYWGVSIDGPSIYRLSVNGVSYSRSEKNFDNTLLAPQRTISSKL